MNIFFKTVLVFVFCFGMHSKIHGNSVFISLTNPELKRFFSHGIETEEDIQVLRKAIRSMVNEEVEKIIAEEKRAALVNLSLLVGGCLVLAVWHRRTIKAFIDLVHEREAANLAE